ncbi:MAG: M28 family metallopeptidase [Candidatus Sericytochromatia bacterium]|nr:M28 family metallopeptidase [Candidatus Sericytochromatia bacterium]
MINGSSRCSFALMLALTWLAAAGCHAQSLPVSRFQPQGRLQPSRVSASKRFEGEVSRERLGTRLSILSGASSFTPRFTIPERGTVEGRSLTRQFITDTLRAQGYEVETQRYRAQGENVFVRLLAPNGSNDWVLLGAHLDSVRNAGADDNGSGSAAVLEAATVLARLSERKVNVIFAFFDEEELGLIGSKAMAKEFRKQGLNLTSVHTADMIGFDSDNDGAVEIERPDGPLWDYYQGVNRSHGLHIPITRTSSGDTDHVAFRAQGFQSVGVCEEWVGKDTTPHYHRKTDTFSTINLDFLVSTTKLLVAVVGDLALGVPFPPAVQTLPHEQFPGRKRHFHPEGF